VHPKFLCARSFFDWPIPRNRNMRVSSLWPTFIGLWKFNFGQNIWDKVWYFWELGENGEKHPLFSSPMEKIWALLGACWGISLATMKIVSLKLFVTILDLVYHPFLKAWAPICQLYIIMGWIPKLYIYSNEPLCLVHQKRILKLWTIPQIEVWSPKINYRSAPL